jgi:hypothetical protein
MGKLFQPSGGNNPPGNGPRFEISLVAAAARNDCFAVSGNAAKSPSPK